MQQIRLWEITPDQRLVEIAVNPISLEERLEEWLESDISALDPNLLVIGRQVDTDFGGTIDLLCLDSAGDTVVIELKKGKTPREVTAQALDYASWVKNLSFDQLAKIADDYFKAPGSLAEKFQERFEDSLPSELNQVHRSLVVAETMDASTERIVRYLSDLKVPINVATVKHFRDANGREMLAQVYLIEPEVIEERSKRASRRFSQAALQAEADRSGIGEMFRRMREGTRGVLLPLPYPHRMWYGIRLANGGQRALLFVWSVPTENGPGMRFLVHASRFSEHRGVSREQLMGWLPENTSDADANVRGWTGSSPEERENARGLGGTFQSEEEVKAFVDGLRTLGQDEG